MERMVSEEKVSAARAYVEMRFPAMAGPPLLEAVFANTKTPPISISFWIAIRKRRTFGLLEADRAMA